MRGTRCVAMTTLHTLRVFLGPDGAGGNPLGVLLDGGAIAPADRQAVAADLGFSETVFVDDRGRASCGSSRRRSSCRSPGHPLVGTAWLLGVDMLPPARRRRPHVAEGELTWIRARPEWATLYDLAQLAVAGGRRRLRVPGGDAMVGVWAWEDEAAGRLRARIFPNGIGIDEDEATGAAAIQFGALLGRDVVIRQGEGSELHVAPGHRRHGRRGRPRGARLRAQLRAGGRGLTSSPPSMVETPRSILCGGRGTRLARRAPQAARRGRRAADRLARRVDLRRAGRAARRAPHGLPRRAGRGVRGGGGLAGGRRGGVRRHGAGHADRRARARRGGRARPGGASSSPTATAWPTSPLAGAARRPRGGGRAGDDDRRAARAAVRRGRCSTGATA